LFAGFEATVTSSGFSCPFIIGYGVPDLAGSDQRHAKAELQPAYDGAAPFDAGAGIDRARKVEPGEHLERLYARDRDRDGESQARSRRVSWP
jgi:hypothetical protein